MKAITDPSKYSLSAKQVVKLLDGMKTVAVAAPAPNGDPLVAPMDGWFLHGKFFFSSGGESMRIAGLRKRPRASIAYFEGEKFLINAHGPVELRSTTRRARSAHAKQMSAASAARLRGQRVRLERRGRLRPA